MNLSVPIRDSYRKLQINEFEVLIDFDGKIYEAVYRGVLFKPGISVLNVSNCYFIPNNVPGKIEEISLPNYTETNILNVVFPNSKLVWKLRPEEVMVI